MINFDLVTRVSAHTIFYNGVHYPITDIGVMSVYPEKAGKIKITYVDGTSWTYPKEIINHAL